MNVDQEDSMIVVTVKYQLPREVDEFWLFCNASKMRSALWSVAQRCRTAYKHGDDEKVGSFAQEIRELIYEEVNLDDCS